MVLKGVLVTPLDTVELLPVVLVLAVVRRSIQVWILDLSSKQKGLLIV